MQEDLLPIRHLSNDELGQSLKRALGADLEESEIAYILERQLSMEGNLHPSLGDGETERRRLRL